MKDLNSARRAGQTAVALAIALCVLAMFVADVRTQDSSSTGDSGGSAGSSSTGDAGTAGASSTATVASSTAQSGYNGSVTNYSINAITPPGEPTQYCNTTDQGALAAYDNTTICIVIGGVAKILYYVNVEDFSLMQLITPLDRIGAFDLPTQWFQGEFSQVASTYKYRRPQNDPAHADYVVPFWTLIITLDNGYVSTIEWDDGCLGSCTPCQDQTCAIALSSCASQAQCDPRFFVGWFGTDRDGRYLTSAGKRYSRFRSYSVSSAFSNAYNTAGDVAPNPTSITFQPSCGDGVTVCETSP